MNKSDFPKIPDYFNRYIDCVDNLEHVEILKKTVPSRDFLEQLLPYENYSYAKNKWTIKEVFQHLVDMERVFCYRALFIARTNKLITLSDVNPDEFALNSNTSNFNIKNVFHDYNQVRKSTIKLFSSFSDKLLLKKGLFGEIEVYNICIPYIVSGHYIWHKKIIEERYLNKKNN